MKIKKLTLRNFRNLSEVELTPGKNLNFFIGSNGQGKTSIVESISFLANFRSFRSNRAEDVISWGALESSAECEVEREPDPVSETFTWNGKLKVFFQKSGEGKVLKRASVNGKLIKSSLHYLSKRFGESSNCQFHAIIFNPSDHALVHGDPASRRTYLDQVISAEDLGYIEALKRYKKLIEQKNALLKSDRPSSSALEIFNDEIATTASQLLLKRIEWLKRLGQIFNDKLQSITDGAQEPLELAYRSTLPPYEHFAVESFNLSVKDLEKAFSSTLETQKTKELIVKTSLVGPHRDDWHFELAARPLKTFGSQGEVRSALLALKLCEISLFHRRTHQLPILIIDDFSSELDQNRRKFLLDLLLQLDLQAFVTSTDDTLRSGQSFQVYNGNITEFSTGNFVPNHSRIQEHL